MDENQSGYVRDAHVASAQTHPHHVFQLLQHLRLTWLLTHWRPTPILAVYVFVNGFITIALLSLLALLTGNPFVFPSLGPTAYLLFFSPLAEASKPREAILGHAVALGCGYGAFVALGLSSFHNGLPSGVFWPRVLAVSLSLSLTAALMVLLRINHPPAGATTMIVSLGIISEIRFLIVIEIAVVLLTMQAFVINRLAGLPYPLWQGVRETHKPVSQDDQ